MAVEETSFPRGGAAPTVKTTEKNNLFKQPTKTKKKSKKKIQHHVVTGAEPKLIALSDLSYKSLSEGLIVLGQITEVTDYFLKVSLPGLIVGRVPLTHISQPYSKLLQSTGQDDANIEALSPLSELFYKGQLVTAQVWQIRLTEDRRHLVTLSLDPDVVHAAWSHSTMAKKGLIVTAAVKSKEEHGYVMDCGVKGLRCFLKQDKATNYCNTFNGGRPLGIGQLVKCIVTKAESTSVASKIELSADPEDVANQENAGHQAVDKQLLLPGMRFNLTVVDSLKDGVEVKFPGSCGYIHRNHMPRLDSKEGASLLEAGTTVFGRVLYVTPLVKSVYFSALPNVNSTVEEIPKPSPSEVHFNVGDIVESAKVTGVGGKGLFLQLGKKNIDVRGFVPERRIGFNYKGKLQDDDDEATMLQRLRKKFPLDSSVRCRLLFFDVLNATYICSLEKSVLEEKYLSFSDVEVGSVVPCIVGEIRNGGILVNVGMLNGFVPATHSADVPLMQPAKKFPPGTRVSGRVLKVDPEKRKMLITLKQTLVSSEEPIITSYQSPRIGACYTGTVAAITDSGVYVSFFGNVSGRLERIPECVPEDHQFYLGQLLKCYVTRRANNQLRLSLVPPTPVKHEAVKKVFKVGKQYNVEVVSVGNAGLEVKVMDDSQNASGIIPVLHLSDNPQVAQSLLNTFEIGTVLTNVWCFRNWSLKEPTVFSMHPFVSQFFKSIPGRIASRKSIDAVSPGLVLPCCVKKIKATHLMLELPLIAVKGLVKVSHEHVCGHGETIADLELVEGQVIQAKVLEGTPHLKLDCRKRETVIDDLEPCVLHLYRHLSENRRLLEAAKKDGTPLGDYHVGKDVSGLVSEKTEWGFVLSLAKGVRAEMTFYNANSDDLEIGTRVKGKVLHVDCVRNHVEVTLRQEICSNLKLQSKENTPVLEADVQLRGPTLLVTPEFVLVQLKGSGKFNLAYIPTHLHSYGKMNLTVSEPFFGIDRKVIIQRSSDGIIICLPKEIVKQHKKKLKAKNEKVKQVKDEVGGRYFDIKIEKDEEECGGTQNTHDEIKIIDKSVDDISEEEEEFGEEESDDIEWHGVTDDLNVPSNSKLDDEKENLSQNETLLAKKRKSEVPDNNDKSVSSPKKSKQESGNKDEVLNPKKKKNIEKSVDSVDSSIVNAVESKKKKREKMIEMGTNEINGTQVVETKKKKTEDTLDEQDKVDSDVQKLTLKNPGFLWDIDPAKFMQVLDPSKHQESSDDDDSDDDKSKKKKHKKTVAERREAAKLEEERLQKLEKDLLDPTRQLTSCDDFDRMVLANPDSSAIWLQYMAFHLQATEIEKARAVAQRAIKTISYREEQEKLNVWLALLNLENLYGTSESLKTTLDQALLYNDAYKIRAHMVRMYAESAKNKELDSEVRLVVRKFKETPGMWQEIGTILMNQGYAEKARSLMQQALQTLNNKKDSVSLIVQFALMEARNNNFEQAKAMMDPILVSYPQRIDIWCTYCDMLVKADQINEARELLERSVSQKLPARKMKTLFTKYLQFEQSHGSKESQEKVKNMASEYVKRVAGDGPLNEEKA